MLQESDDLLRAADDGDVSKVRSILASSGGQGKVSLANSVGVTPLWAACNAGRVHIVRLLLDRKADTRALSFGMTALHIAVQKQEPDAVRLLLERKASVNYAEGQVCSPLHVAAQFDAPECLKLLLQHKASVDDTRRGRNDDVIVPSSGSGSAAAAAAATVFAKTGPVGDDGSSMEGFTALHVACNACNLAAARLLLEARANPRAAVGTLEWKTPLALVCALERGNAPLVGLLLEYLPAAGKNNQDDFAFALALCAGRHNASAVLLLVRAKTSLRPPRNHPHAALPSVVANSQRDPEPMVQLLLEHRAYVDATMTGGCTALIESAKKGCVRARAGLRA